MLLHGHCRGFFFKSRPGPITSTSDTRPSGISTYSIAGTAFGYAPLWTALCSISLMASRDVYGGFEVPHRGWSRALHVADFNTRLLRLWQRTCSINPKELAAPTGRRFRAPLNGLR